MSHQREHREQREQQPHPHHSHSGIDFRNLCQRFDVENLKAKLPALPPLPQLKYPKALPRLRGRKIFRSSRENVNLENKKSATPQHELSPPAPHAQFINHTPTRISTISSLMNERSQEHGKSGGMAGGRNTYRSAGSVDDVDYYGRSTGGERISRPISPVRLPATTPDDGVPARLSLGQRLQRGYKDISEFRLKHLFAKKTVVRRDGIEVQRYVEQYDEERRYEQLEQQCRDREIADNYKIKFHMSRQSTLDSPGTGGSRPPPGRPSVGEHSGDESGMESTPPARKPGIAATRFSKVRNPPLPMPDQEETGDEAGAPKARGAEAAPRASRSSYKERMKQLRGSSSQLLTKLPNLTGSKPKIDETTTDRQQSQERKRRAPLSPQQSEENQAETTATTGAGAAAAPMRQAIRKNIKRLHKSIKRVQVPKTTTTATKTGANATATDDSDEDQPTVPTVKPTRSARLKARLRRFKSSEEVSTDAPTESLGSRLQQHWRNNFKRGGDDQSSPEKDKDQTREQVDRDTGSGNLLQKLRHIRTRKAPSQDDLDEDATGPAGTSASANRGMAAQLEERFTQARQRTMKKVNEKMQQIKFFQRGTNAEQASSRSPKPNTVGHEPVEIDDEELDATYHHSNSSSEQEDSEQYDTDQELDACEAHPTAPSRRRQKQGEHADSLSQDSHADVIAAHEMATLDQLQARTGGGSGVGLTAWTTEPILCEESQDSDGDAADASVYPRVLIHQDHSDAFESTLIIAVTRAAASASPAPRSNLLEAAPAPPRRSSAGEWVPNEQIIAGFLATDAEAAWQTQSKQKPLVSSTLYKPKSIDIFEASARQGGVSAAFGEDFEDALRNTPVVKISADSSDSYEEAGTELSKTMAINPVTTTTQLKRQIGNSRESLIAHMGGEPEESDDAEDEDDEEDTDSDGSKPHSNSSPPSAAPSPPPRCSPPPPPLPERRPPQPPPPTVAPIYDAVPPPLPATKPPQAVPTSSPVTVVAAVVPHIPERSASMSRPAKPLVKTSSLRLTYNEQVRPGDVGKVNKLISRFEGPQQQQRTRPRLIARRLHSEEYDMAAYSDNDGEELEALEARDTTPTPANINRRTIPEIVTTLPTSCNNNINNNMVLEKLPVSSATQATALSLDRQNSNCSRSEYGSPLAYPSSRRGSNDQQTPTALCRPHRQQIPPQVQPQQQSRDQLELQRQTRRSRRSMTRDDDNFYSFDSDEENSYYSISPSGSSRYVVEI
ncbi:PHD finger protein rhinoceros [Scaptodrosophila lebanonensis]|uniref:PHD finger protein rhinoceros n=1 Tax=Drosophila lebanonensis TaxID=7225 RepID=A0A6J2TTY3_DROLE|nr:PHD finger protein rhinoceros [Scaptodrosophila lebanonensis]